MDVQKISDEISELELELENCEDEEDQAVIKRQISNLWYMIEEE